ncbi:hypothetical protein PV10_00271 [Exophiala mesophila]|uniref:5'-hydroxyaverantin dehydrogenase n=1 Tax=Exophiala mesophila TaxID=212818 RepID=A0A0D2ABU7_EXOME|nr:uncharacterized protein PV10_00271 [Exophiala mesophila]KIV96393.1 hypothetical protein PV10_00271 [Exophiala mesophila]
MASSSARYQNTGPVDCSTPVDASSLSGKTAIVTGGSNGIGATYTHVLVNAGKVHYSKCDVTKWADQAALFKSATAKSPSGNIDIVVVNAGISGQDPVFLNPTEGGEPEEPDLKILNVNLIGATYTVKLALHYFEAQAARDPSSVTSLVLQGSLAGYVNQPGTPQYNASKYGLRGMLGSLRQTSLIHGTRVNYIAPWYIKTDIINDAALERITSKGVVLAEIGDAGEALLRIVSNQSIHGRAIAIVPRIWAPRGHLDVNHDDYPEDDFIHEWQHLVLKTSHRLVGASLIP